MPDLSFKIERASAVAYAAAPTIGFELHISNGDRDKIQTAILRCQIMIETTRRSYGVRDQERLRDLFDAPGRWGQTLRTMLWTHVNFTLPSFTDATTFELQVPCSFDFNAAATKYFYGIEEGAIPLCFQFSGTIFYENESGAWQIAPVSWSQEARFALPLKTWREMMDEYYPNSAWLSVRRDIFERLYQFKIDRGFATWEEVLEQLLPEAVRA